MTAPTLAATPVLAAACGALSLLGLLSEVVLCLLTAAVVAGAFVAVYSQDVIGLR